MATTLYKRIDNGGVRSNSAKVPKVAQDEHNSSSNDTPLQDSEGQGAKNCLHVVQKAASLTSMFTAPLVAIHLNCQISTTVAWTTLSQNSTTMATSSLLLYYTSSLEYLHQFYSKDIMQAL